MSEPGHADQLLIYKMQTFQKCLLVYVSYSLFCAFVTNLGYLDAVSGTICSIYVEVTHPVLHVLMLSGQSQFTKSN